MIEITSCMTLGICYLEIEDYLLFVICYLEFVPINLQISKPITHYLQPF